MDTTLAMSDLGRGKAANPSRKNAIAALGDRYGKRVAILSIAGAAVSQSGCSNNDLFQSACTAELGACLEGAGSFALPNGGNGVIGDVRFIVADMPANLNKQAVSLTVTALSSPGCTMTCKPKSDCDPPGHEEYSYWINGEAKHIKYETPLTSGVVEQGTPNVFKISGREYTVNLSRITDGVATLSVAVACPQ